MTAWAVVAGIVFGLGLWCLASLLPRLDRPRFAGRIAPYLQDVSAGARELLEPAAPGPVPVLDVLLRPVLEPLRRATTGLHGGSELIARRLRQAGSRLSADAYRGQQVVAALSGLAVGMALAAAVAGFGAASIVLVTAGGVGGAVVRDALLARAARRRLARLAEELPVVLEFLALSLSAGEGILDALRRVARTGTGDLSAEFAAVVSEAATGRPLPQTLADMARELQLSPLTRCVDQLLAALERGTPLGEVLRAQAQDSRDDARRALLEAAGRKEIAMLFPLVLMILPVTVLFAVFPGLVVLQIGL